jgi:hypothetical protein
MQIDHIFIRVLPGGAEAELLRALGLSEGSGNTHPGQGTANRRFFFANAFIELLWIADAEEIANEQTRPTSCANACRPTIPARPRRSASASVRPCRLLPGITRQPICRRA